MERNVFYSFSETTYQIDHGRHQLLQLADKAMYAITPLLNMRAFNFVEKLVEGRAG